MTNKAKKIVLGVVSVLAVGILSSSVQAAPYKTIPPSACQASKAGDLKPGQLTIWSEFIRHTDVSGGSSSTNVYCPLIMHDNAPATIGVWINYSEVSAAGMNCYVKTNHYSGLPKISINIPTPVGLKKSVYQTIDTGSWWSTGVDCSIKNGDKIHSLNFKAL